jgi:DICT domain-containing protein
MSELGIGDLARRTGLTPQVIRAWETRFGFPRPRRTPSGRRTYDPRDVDRIARVLTLKESGSRLAQAIARVVDQGDTDARDLSVYGELRRLLPHLASRVMRRDVLVAISRAIEDEALARSVRPLVFGAFQREEFYRGSADRWRELARTAEGCVVFADFPQASPVGARPVLVALDHDSPLLREWAVVVRSTDFSAVLTAWEVPDLGATGERRFETIFSLEPEAVRVAVDTCLAAARAAGVPDEALLRDPAAVAMEPPRTPSPGVDALVLRAFGYLQELTPPA